MKGRLVKGQTSRAIAIYSPSDTKVHCNYFRLTGSSGQLSCHRPRLPDLIGLDTTIVFYMEFSAFKLKELSVGSF